MRRILWLLLLAPALAFGQPADGVVQLPDVVLHYRCIGEGEPLLILSGGPGLDVGYMLGLAKPLSDKNRCILLEQRGTGRSVPAKIGPRTYVLDAYVEDVEALRKSLHLGELNILGHSWGGMLAMAYASRYPDRVHSLVLLSSRGMDLATLAGMSAKLESRPAKEDIAAHDILPAYFYDRKMGQEFAAKQGHSRDAAVGQIAGSVFVNLQKTHYDLRVALTAFHGPTFISQGREDVIGDDTATKIQETIYGSQVLYIEKCGHFEWMEQPQALLPPLEAFLTANAGSAGEKDFPPAGGIPGHHFGHHGRG